MIRHLYVIRHAETFDKAFGQTDVERELTLKGKEDAGKLGHYIKSLNIKFDIVFCSPANRTKATSKLMMEASENKIETIIDPRLYHASVHDLVKIVSGFNDEYSHVAIVGHNPAISALANSLSPTSIDSFSPCTIGGFQFAIGQWGDLQLRRGQLEFIHSPLIL